jgi:hypothetical protein
MPTLDITPRDMQNESEPRRRNSENLDSSGVDEGQGGWVGEGWALLLDVVSLFPEENGPEGSVSPFRKDLLELLKGLNPRCVPTLLSYRWRWGLEELYLPKRVCP